MATAEAELEIALAELETKKHLCAKRQTLYRDQEATAFLLKGAIASSRASKTNYREERNKFNRIALNHFSRALEMEPNDPEIVEYVAHQYRALDDLRPALEHYLRLCDETSSSYVGRRQSRARALRYAGEIHEKLYETSGVVVNLRSAKEYLQLALECLPACAVHT